MSLDALLSRLDKVRGSGNQFTACCPAHDDRDPSLTITETPEGKVLVHCHGGCSPEAVAAAAGLSMADLFTKPLPKGKRKEYAARASRSELESALYHELLVLSEIVGTRVSERQMAQNTAFRAARPDWRPMPGEHWDREIQAAGRIKYGLGVLYD